MSSNMLDQSLSSDGQGVGNISDNPLLKLIAQMVERVNGQFGQPVGSDEVSSGGNSPL